MNEEVKKLRKELSELEYKRCEENTRMNREIAKIKEYRKINHIRSRVLNNYLEEEHELPDKKIQKAYCFSEVLPKKRVNNNIRKKSIIIGAIAIAAILLTFFSWIEFNGVNLHLWNIKTGLYNNLKSYDYFYGTIPRGSWEQINSDVRLLQWWGVLCFIIPAGYAFVLYNILKEGDTITILSASISGILFPFVMIILNAYLVNSWKEDLGISITPSCTAIPLILIFLGIAGIVVQMGSSFLEEEREFVKKIKEIPCMNYSLTGNIRFIFASCNYYNDESQGIVLKWITFGMYKVKKFIADIEFFDLNNEGIRIKDCVFFSANTGLFPEKSSEIRVEIPGWNIQRNEKFYIYPKEIELSNGQKDSIISDIVNVEISVDRIKELRMHHIAAVREYSKGKEIWICQCGAINENEEGECTVCGIKMKEA